MKSYAFVAGVALLLSPLPAMAEPTPSGGPESAGEAAATPPSKSTYSLPFSLRPAIVPTVVRLDAAVVDTKTGGVLASTFTAGAQVAPNLGVYVRGAFVRVSPDAGNSATGIANPSVFALYGLKMPSGWKSNVFAGLALPLGQGGGNKPDVRRSLAVGSGVYARQAMDNALFAVNFATPMVGAGVARVANGLTVQIEGTVLQLIRARGEDVEKDSTRTNFTTGVHVGYAVIDPLLVVSTEAHYQRWLSTPAAVTADGNRREQATVGLGLRSNLVLSGSITARPGIGYFLPVDAPMTKGEYRSIVIDLPVTF